MTDPARRQDPIVPLLSLLVISLVVAAAWVPLAPGEALVLPAVAVFFFCERRVEVSWKDGADVQI